MNYFYHICRPGREPKQICQNDLLIWDCEEKRVYYIICYTCKNFPNWGGGGNGRVGGSQTEGLEITQPYQLASPPAKEQADGD